MNTLSSEQSSRGGVRWGSIGIALYVIALWVLLLFGAGGTVMGRTHSLQLLWLAFACIAVILLVAAADHWVRVFPGILLYGMLNSTRTIFSGHLSIQPETSISRSAALAHTLALAAVTAASFAFYKRKLNQVDRVALLIFISSLACSMVSERAAYVALAIALCSSLVSWGHGHLHRRRSSQHGG
jgi:hypothetical protein